MHRLSFSISNTYRKTDSGINYIEIEAPENISWKPDNLISLVFYADKGQRLFRITAESFKGIYPNTRNKAVYSVKDQRLIIVLETFLKGSDNNLRDQISMTVPVYAASEFNNGLFRIHVEGRQFQDMQYTWNNSATCGLQRSRGSFYLHRADLITANNN